MPDKVTQIKFSFVSVLATKISIKRHRKLSGVFPVYPAANLFISLFFSPSLKPGGGEALSFHAAGMSKLLTYVLLIQHTVA